MPANRNCNVNRGKESSMTCGPCGTALTLQIFCYCWWKTCLMSRSKISSYTCGARRSSMWRSSKSLPPEAVHEQLAIVAHQYDPFTNDYTEISDFRKPVSWYPDKLMNMNERPFYIFNPINMNATHNAVSVKLEVTRAV